MCSAPEGPRHSARPSPSAFVRNLRAPGYSPGRRAWLVVRNNVRKVVTLKSCCGHCGEPGC